MDDEERLKKAFDFSADLTKQLITLATGIIGLTITFSHDFLRQPEASPRWMAMWGWYLLLASVGFGIATLSALTGNLDAKDKTKTLTIYAPNIMAFGGLQFLTFGGGVLLTILYAASSV